MKHIFVLLFLSAFTEAGGQVDSVKAPNRPKTRIEEFADRQSHLYVREFIDIGKTRSFEVQILKYTDLTDDKSISGIRINWTKSTGTYTASSYGSFLDLDEVDDLSKALVRMYTVTSQVTPTVYTEYVFKSKSGFEITVFSGPGKSWRASIENDRYSSAIFFSPDELSRLQSFLQTAKGKL